MNDYLGSYLKNKAPDCILYSEDGAQFKTHKELFGQTKFMRELLKSQNCCGAMEVILPCSKEELGHLMNFLNEGKIKCNKKIDSLKIIDNLNKILGYPDDYIDNIWSDVLDEKENCDIQTVSESGDNKDSEEPIIIVQEVKVAAKKKGFTLDEKNESDTSQRCKMINLQSRRKL